MVLEQIVANKAKEVAERKGQLPLDAIRRDLDCSDRSLVQALQEPRTGFVLECKKASPSRGLIRPDFDPVEIAGAYAPFADAISVITDERFFMGRLEYVRAVREQVRVPVLLKDFVLEPYQVFEARRFGADAVLLMLSVLDDAGYERCAAAAESLQMDVLTEAHDHAELERAIGLGARIIGINNRNLKNLEVDLDRTRTLAPQVPSDRVVLCESGIRTHGDVRQLRPLVDGFLVGTSLVSEADLTMACRELVYGPVKVCGLTRPSDARNAARAGAVYGGLIFAKNSPRYIGKDQAVALQGAADLRWVGVFVNEAPDRVVRTARELALYAVQLHGDEDREYMSELRGQLGPSCEIWKAHRVRDRMPDLDYEHIDKVVLDAFSKQARGGTGERFDWSVLEGRDLSRIVLAGGLKPENAARADALGPGGLDVSSGVEEAPGIKSPERLTRFFGALRGTPRSAK